MGPLILEATGAVVFARASIGLTVRLGITVPDRAMPQTGLSTPGPKS